MHVTETLETPVEATRTRKEHQSSSQGIQCKQQCDYKQPEERPKEPDERPKSGQRGQKHAQRSQKSGQRASKGARRAPEAAKGRLKDQTHAHKKAQRARKRPKVTVYCACAADKSAQGGQIDLK